MTKATASKLKEVGHDQYQVIGDIDFNTASALLEDGRKRLKKDSNLVISLIQIKKSSSVAVALILQLLEDAKKLNVTLSFTDIPDDIIELAKISNVDNLIYKCSN